MTKILSAGVCWNHGAANLPELEILVNKIPNYEEALWECKDGVFYAEQGGIVHMFAGDMLGLGYGGRSFALKMKNGKTVTLKGPMSGSAQLCNEKGFGPCVDVLLTDKPETMRKTPGVYCGTFMAGSVTLAFARKAARLAKVHLVEMNDGAEFGNLSGVQELIVHGGCGHCWVPSVCKTRIQKAKPPAKKYMVPVYNLVALIGQEFEGDEDDEDPTPQERLGVFKRTWQAHRAIITKAMELSEDTKWGDELRAAKTTKKKLDVIGSNYGWDVSRKQVNVVYRYKHQIPIAARSEILD